MRRYSELFDVIFGLSFSTILDESFGFSKKGGFESFVEKWIL